MKHLGFLVCAALSQASLGCGSDPTGIADVDRVASVTLQYAEGSPKAQGLGLQNPPARLLFQARDTRGELISGLVPTFVSTDTTAFVVTPDGYVTARRAPAGALIIASLRTSTRVFADTVRALTAVAL